MYVYHVPMLCTLCAQEFGQYGCSMTPSLHRALQLSTLYMKYYKDQGFSWGPPQRGQWKPQIVPVLCYINKHTWAHIFAAFVPMYDVHGHNE